MNHMRIIEESKGYNILSSSCVEVVVEPILQKNGSTRDGCAYGEQLYLIGT